MSSNSFGIIFSVVVEAFTFLLFFSNFFGLDLVRDVTLITAGSPPKPNIPDFPGETTSILTSSRFAFSSSRASFVASSTVLP